ncbi:lipoyl-protein ligase [Wigglesworthia glossinidia endosymbiont of Glossina morsitans morsitans (Yale colony)]|uniref:Octanoyltransferase n=1 Tax=Wigglesworthia glossinidia endosymbiont of Glossina morsitans morsitans (Yale colony) TaxID=1142511 RepID=H6Q5D9_WIGGL|nr:lipoyl(octanoyl) transferase LipB [Wigglesworthia glossinidia]AFA41422.1 lipoyl-protein ligase [Wigglesworthia glossinidia endosymbiont of Glossina morsitans morsitans (Yale colony)]
MNTTNIRLLGVHKYEHILHAMYNYINKNKINHVSEIWFLEHYPVFTLGNLDKFQASYISNIPVIKTDRGGHITFHAPGQQVIYFLLNVKKLKIGIKQLILILEQIVISTLLYFKIYSYLIKGYPGVYVQNKKICSLGLRIYQGYSLHGLALNVKMDLSPFSYIYPCGNANIKMTQISEFFPKINLNMILPILIKNCKKFLMIEKKNINFFHSIKLC